MRLQLQMRTVATGADLRVFAAAEPDAPGALRDESERRKTAALVGAVAKGLLGTQTASTPVVGLAGLDFHEVWSRLGNLRRFHGVNRKK